MSIVSLEHVKKIYPGNVQAVHDLSLAIRDKEFMVLVGPSGCGKTTTLRMVAGLEEITEGTVSIGDRVVNDVLPKDRNIAMVFQNYAIYPHMTVFENLAFGLRQRKFPKAEINKRVNAAAKSLGIDMLLQRRPKALSGGQRQRVAVGRAIVREPEVFLFDEPLSNLDAKMRVEMRKELKLLHHRLQTTIIYVTHDQVEAMTLGDRVCVMNDGRIEQVGRPIEIYDRPVTRFVASFIGMPPMNFFAGRLVGDSHAINFEGTGFMAPMPAAKLKSLTPFAGRQVELGLRPEDLLLVTEGPAEEGQIPGQILLIEALGNELLVYVKVANETIICRADPHIKIAVGQDVRMRPKPHKIHVFDCETKVNLMISDGGSQGVATTREPVDARSS